MAYPQENKQMLKGRNNSNIDETYPHIWCQELRAFFSDTHCKIFLWLFSHPSNNGQQDSCKRSWLINIGLDTQFPLPWQWSQPHWHTGWWSVLSICHGQENYKLEEMCQLINCMCIYKTIRCICMNIGFLGGSFMYGQPSQFSPVLKRLQLRRSRQMWQYTGLGQLKFFLVKEWPWLSTIGCFKLRTDPSVRPEMF